MFSCKVRLVSVWFVLAANYQYSLQCENSEEVEIAKSLYKTGNIDIAEITNLSEEKKTKYCNHNNAETKKPEEIVFEKALYKAGRHEDLKTPITLDTIKKKLKDSGVFDADDISLSNRQRKEAKKLFESVEIMTTSRARQPSTVQNMFTALRMVERAVKKQLKEGQISEALASKFRWEKIDQLTDLGSNQLKNAESNESKSSESNEPISELSNELGVYLPKIYKKPTKVLKKNLQSEFASPPPWHVGGSLSFIYKYTTPNTYEKDGSKNIETISTTENYKYLAKSIKRNTNKTYFNISSTDDSNNSTIELTNPKTETENLHNQTKNVTNLMNWDNHVKPAGVEQVIDDFGYTVNLHESHSPPPKDIDRGFKLDKTDSDSTTSESADNNEDYASTTDSDDYYDDLAGVTPKKWTETSDRWFKQLS